MPREIIATPIMIATIATPIALRYGSGFVRKLGFETEEIRPSTPPTAMIVIPIMFQIADMRTIFSAVWKAFAQVTVTDASGVPSFCSNTLIKL